MTFEEYKTKYGQLDHVLIKMTDHFPYFSEKVIVEDGKDKIDNSYHVAVGTYCTYVNYEIHTGGSLSAEVEKLFTFENYLSGDKSVFITNIGDEPFEIRLSHGQTGGMLRPGVVLGIYPKVLENNTQQQFDEEYFNSDHKMLSQSEINWLLTGHTD